MGDTGSIIAELRREAGYTQKSLAEQLNITDKAVSKWERGISLPDVALLPKLSLLLDADIELLLSQKSSRDKEKWYGLIDLSNDNVDLSQKVYDKPLVYYLLSHFLLLGITKIYIKTNKKNQKYLSSQRFFDFGFDFVFDFDELPKNSFMIMNHPWFLFGSDLTRQFQGAMVTDKIVKVVPIGVKSPFLFVPFEYSFMYMKNPEYLFEIATSKTLGRGMLCINMNTDENVNDIANFVKIYQQSSGMLIGDLKEIASIKGCYKV